MLGILQKKNFAGGKGHTWWSNEGKNFDGTTGGKIPAKREICWDAEGIDTNESHSLSEGNTASTMHYAVVSCFIWPASEAGISAFHTTTTRWQR